MRITEFLDEVFIVIGFIMVFGLLFLSAYEITEQANITNVEDPVAVIKEYETPTEYLESPFDYESDVVGEYVEVQGKVTGVDDPVLVGDLRWGNVEVTVNDNIICDVIPAHMTEGDITGKEVAIRGYITSEGAVLELNDCDIRVTEK